MKHRGKFDAMGLATPPRMRIPQRSPGCTGLSRLVQGDEPGFVDDREVIPLIGR